MIKRVFALIRGQRGLTNRRALGSLTAREREILKLLPSGMSYVRIAEARGNKTSVSNVVYRVQEKLGADSKQEVVIWAVKNGLLEDAESGG